MEIGRVAQLTSGPQAGKLVVIIDLIDQRRVGVCNIVCMCHIRVCWLQALITGPCSGVPRQAMSLTNLTLTRFTIKIPHSARDRTVRKSFQTEKIKEKWLETALAKRIALREKRAKLTDFDRFKIKCLKQQVRLA